MKQILFLSLSIAFLTTSVKGQQFTIEQIKKEVQTLNGTQRVDALIDIANYHLTYGFYNLKRRNGGEMIHRSEGNKKYEQNEIKAYLSEALDLALTLEYEDGLAVTYYFSGRFYEAQNNNQLAESHYLKWLDTRIIEGDKSKMKWAYRGVASFYHRRGNPENVLTLRQQSLDLEDKTKLSKIGLLTYYMESWYAYRSYYRAREYSDFAFSQMVIALEELTSYLSENAEFDRFYVGVFTHMDYFYEREILRKISQGDYQHADKLGKQWLKSKEKFSDELGSYISARRIARLFYDAKQPEYTFEFIERSIQYAKASNDLPSIRAALRNACYISRVFEERCQAFDYIIQVQPYYTLDWEAYEILLNTSLNAIILYDIQKEKEQTIARLTEWKETMIADGQLVIVNWIEAALYILEN